VDESFVGLIKELKNALKVFFLSYIKHTVSLTRVLAKDTQ